MKKKINNNDTLYIVMPAYNEEENIEDVVISWYQNLKFGSKDSKIIIADSGSTDQTHKILKNLQKKYPELIILSKGLKQHGPKLIELYKCAIDNGADWIFQTDSDGQTNPNEFKSFWDLRKSHDAIIGNRTIREDGKHRKFVENTLCKILRIIFGVKLKDANAPFRLMKTSLVKKYINKFNIDYNLPNVMLCVFFKYYNENIVFKEITFKPRKAGVNSINIKKIFKIGMKSLKDFKDFQKEMKI